MSEVQHSVSDSANDLHRDWKAQGPVEGTHEQFAKEKEGYL